MRDPRRPIFDANENSNQRDAGCSISASHSLPTMLQRPVQAAISFPLLELLAVPQQHKSLCLRAERGCAPT